MTVMNQRAEILLRTLIERYIAEGAPVGSRALAKYSGLKLSPATIRNVMSDLEELGLIKSPHTSAGRIPTQQGYRVFVDSLIKIQAPDTTSMERIQLKIAGIEDPGQALSTVSQLLSNMTQMAAIVSIPKREETLRFRQIEFLQLSVNRILVILVTTDGSVQNRVIHSERQYASAELVEASNYFNETYSGQSLSRVKEVLLRELEADGEAMQKYAHTAVQMARKVLDEQAENNTLLVSGESNLMEFPDLGDVRKLRGLFDAFNKKRDLLHLLDQSGRNPGVKIFIGRESGYDVLEDCSVIAAPYQVDGQIVGTLGVVGPTRMSYERVIPVVDLTAKLLSAALNPEN